jgi:transmembrane sensor
MTPTQQHPKNTPAPNIPACADPCDAAAFWFARQQSGEMSEVEHREFDIWKASDSAHEREYQALQQAWAAARHIPEYRLRALADDCETSFRYRSNIERSPRWRLASMAFAFLISCAAAFAGYQWQQAQPVFTTSIDTGQDERVKTALPDGSSVHANIRTQYADQLLSG